MKVILLCDVPKQGKKNEVINVSDGYGTNYLVKNKLAIVANEKNLHDLNNMKERNKKNEDELVKELIKVKEKLEKEKIEFQVKTGKEDKLFGSISNKQIFLKLTEMGYSIKKENIVVEYPITTLGMHKVKIVLHKKVEAKIMISVIK